MAINFDHQLNKITTGNSDIDFDITGSLKLPVGTTAQRTGTLTGGEVRFNSTNNLFEGYNGTDWLSLGALEDNTIGSLQDVDTTGITTGQVLKWNGTSFVPGNDEEDLSNNTTDDLAEGTNNLYYTDARADARVNAQTGTNLDLSNKSTDDLPEGTNLYYTDARVNTRIGASSVGDLSDVDTTTNAPTDGQVLKWNAAQGLWLPQADLSGSGGATAIGDLNDVSNSAPSVGQVLKWDGSQWVPSADATSSSGGGGIDEGDAIAFAIALGS